jgi:hypothetical protein
MGQVLRLPLSRWSSASEALRKLRWLRVTADQQCLPALIAHVRAVGGARVRVAEQRFVTVLLPLRVTDW